jgi:Kef-type K+ transport system membrane component KefB
MELFLEFTAIVILATVLSIILRILKQPLVVGYIFTGIILGPHILNIVHTTSYIELFSKIGITILLFIVGLNLKPSVIREVGKVSLFGGLGQIIITTILGFGLSLLLGITFLHSLYIGLALSFSSTIIILKLLSDKDDLPKVYGKVTVGFLLIQDLVAILALLFISSFAGAQHQDLVQTTTFLFLKLFIAGLSVYLISKYLITHAIHHLAQSQELLFLFSIAWGLGLASVFYLIGFSVEVGALIAGVSLSVTPFADSIASRLKPLRDFFIVLFFILLGSNLELTNISGLLLPTILLSLFVLIGKPLIVFYLMNVLGYKTKQSFQTGISLAQVSEFSLILVTLGLSTGILDDSTVTIITLTALITIAGSSYFILYSDEIFPYLEKKLKQLEIVHSVSSDQTEKVTSEIALFGFDRVGHDFIEAFEKLNKKYVVVDYNPEMIQQLENSTIPFKYGDVEDVEFLRELQLKKIKLCVSTIPDIKVNILLIKKIKEENADAIIIVRAREVHEAKILYNLGATYVVMPHYLGAKYATSMIKRIGLNSKGFKEEREKHFDYLNKNKQQ